MADNKTNKVHEPLIRVVKRDTLQTWKCMIIRFAALLLALLIDALLISTISDYGIADTAKVMVDETFGNPLRLGWALRDVALLLGIGIALAPAFKMRFWNIGAEGQVLAGALAATVIMYYCCDMLSETGILIVMLVVSIVAGALWGFIPSFFKAKFGTNETLFTLMMNYVAIQLVACATEAWRGKASSLGKINTRTKMGWLPKLDSDFLSEIINQRYFWNIIIIAALTVAMYFYLKRSKHGYEIAVVGESENTARYAGINVKKTIMRTMAISGAICGIVGFLTIAGKDQTISVDTAGGNGFTAIIVTWIAKFNTFTMAAIAFLLIFIERGASGIASSAGLNPHLEEIVSSIVLFMILGCEFFINYKVILRKKAGKEVK